MQTPNPHSGERRTALQDYPGRNPRGPRDFYASGLELRDYHLGGYTLS